MKYEAKRVESTNVLISQTINSPWANISQTDAISYSKNVPNCDNCHLIDNNEWLTIANDIASLPENWSGGSVGSGFIFSGHNDANPDNALAADVSDINGYSGTGNSVSVGVNQKRTLRLTNGEIIWDFSGNVDEWTDNVITSGNHPGRTGTTEFIELNWNDPTLELNGLDEKNLPSYSMPQASSWTTIQGLGVLYSKRDANLTYGYIRSGSWHSSYKTGIFNLNLNATPSTVYQTIGFRVAS